MTSRLVLPVILGVRLYNFHPIFQHDIEETLDSGLYIVLGGNGLGKTTTVQAIVYGLCGGLSDEDIESTKSLRWDHYYFRDRLDPEIVTAATVEVDFTFGDVVLTVRRGFRTSKVVGVRIGDDEWIEDSIFAQDALENAVMEFGNYRHFDDFRFLVHRLLYLPESRRLIAWDYDAQVRIFMLLNQDLVDEHTFREQQDGIKNIDSDKRHVHVALENVRRTLDQVNLGANKEEDTARDPDATETTLAKLITQLKSATANRRRLEAEAGQAANELGNVAIQVESLRTQIENSESTLIAASLRRVEDVYQLPLHKLLENGICPACGTVQRDMQSSAQDNARNGRCLLCGSEEPQEIDPQLMTLRSQLSEKLGAQQTLENEYLHLSARLEDAHKEESRIRSRIDEIRFDQPVVALVERHLADLLQQKNLPELKRRLEMREQELEIRLIEEKSKLEREYQSFLLAADDRTEGLRQIYERYATDFLGLPCRLSVRTRRSVISFSQFVPEFENRRRDTPESCSEAQRFFLDIAFRLALIEWTARETSTGATFVCETPETALDMSYVDNVVTMLSGFMQMGHSMLLTANIQPFGIAEKLMDGVPRDERASRVLDLLEIGRPSQVHLDSMATLREVVNRIKGEE